MVLVPSDRSSTDRKIYSLDYGSEVKQLFESVLQYTSIRPSEGEKQEVLKYPHLLKQTEI